MQKITSRKTKQLAFGSQDYMDRKAMKVNVPSALAAFRFLSSLMRGGLYWQCSTLCLATVWTRNSNICSPLQKEPNILSFPPFQISYAKMIPFVFNGLLLRLWNTIQPIKLTRKLDKWQKCHCWVEDSSAWLVTVQTKTDKIQSFSELYLKTSTSNWLYSLL